MPYPDAPWILKGFALQTLHGIDRDRARSLLPPELNILEIWPGKTLGGLYLATYGAGSTLEYHELIVVAGIGRDQHNHIGAWISHIYVDHPDSVAGGRNIWGLPKELAEFEWSNHPAGQITVRQGDRMLCQVQYSRKLSLWPQKLSGFSFGQRQDRLLWFKAEAQCRPGWSQARLEIPANSPFASLQLHQPTVTAIADDLRLTVQAPNVVGSMTATPQPYSVS